MKTLTLLILSLFLVSCGNEYGISKGTNVKVAISGSKYPAEGKLHKVTNDMLILKMENGDKLSIPKQKVTLVREWEN